MLRRTLIAVVLAGACLATNVGADGASYDRVTAWGDSLTYGVNMPDGESYPEQLATISGREVENRGVNNHTTTSVLTDMLAAENHRGVTVIWAGRNNIKTFDDQTALEDIAAMVDLAEDGKYLVLSVISAGNEPKGSVEYDWVASLNEHLAETYGDHYLDVLTPLLNAEGATAEEIVGRKIPKVIRMDDLHLRAEGYRIVAEQVAGKLLSLNL